MVKKLGLYVLAAFLLLILSGVVIFNTIQYTSESEERPAASKQIEFLHWDYFPDEIFDLFHKEYPDITVNYHRYVKDNYSGNIRLRMQSGEQTDVIGVPNEDYQEFVSSRKLVDLSSAPYMNSFKQDVRNAVKAISSDKEYAVAYRSTVYGMWYNTILFNKFNIKPPLDYADFLNACQVLKSNGVHPVILGGKDGYSAVCVYLLRLMDLFDEDDWRTRFGSGTESFFNDKSQRRISETLDLIRQEYIDPASVDLTYQQAFEYFKQSRAAMLIAPDYSINLAGQDMEKVVAPGVGFIPYADSELNIKAPVVKADDLIGIYSGSQNREAANKFLAFLSRPDIALLYSKATMSYPTVKGVDIEHLQYNSLWEPLRKMVSVPIDFFSMPRDVKNQLQLDARLLLTGKYTTYQFAEVLSKLYSYTPTDMQHNQI